MYVYNLMSVNVCKQFDLASKMKWCRVLVSCGLLICVWDLHSLPPFLKNIFYQKNKQTKNGLVGLFSWDLSKFYSTRISGDRWNTFGDRRNTFGVLWNTFRDWWNTFVINTWFDFVYAKL